MAGLFEKAFLRALNEDSFADMVRDGKAPVSEEEVDELLVPLATLSQSVAERGDAMVVIFPRVLHRLV